MSSSASGKRFKMLNKHKAVVQSLHMIRTNSIIMLDELNTPTSQLYTQALSIHTQTLRYRQTTLPQHQLLIDLP